MTATAPEWTLPCAAPRFATARNPELRTDGAAAGAISRWLCRGRYGRPDGFYPAQQYLADVAGERNPDGSYRYPVVMFSLPRQAGKTVTARVSQVARAATQERQLIYYTAQTGLKARARWLDSVAALEEPGSPFRRFISVNRGAGPPAIRFPNRSVISPFPPTANSLHSETPNRVDLDEIWDLSAEQGDALLTAIKPAQITLRDRQIWLYSAAGESASEFMWSWTLMGRAAVTDPASKIAYFEWSAPDEAESYDPATWRKYHPGIGHLITEDDIADAIASFPNRLAFDRSYLNRWAPEDAKSPINREVWKSRADRQLTRPDIGDLVLAFAVAPDRSDAAIVAAWRTAERPVVAVLQYSTDATWLLDQVPEWVRLTRPAVVAAEARGEARDISDRLGRGTDPVTVHQLPPLEYVTACGSFLTAVTADGLAHDGAEPLTNGVALARTKALAGAWVWDEHRPYASVLRAATVASWVYVHRPEVAPPVPKARVVTLAS